MSLAVLGHRLSRDTALYASANLATFVFGVLNIVLLTRLLPIGEFADLALYFVFAALLTVLYNAGSLQGALMLVFGGSETGELSAEDSKGKVGVSLAAAFVLTGAICVVGTAVVLLTAPVIAEVLSGDRADAASVRWAGVSGASGALWRLAVNVPRFERRPVTYVAASALRPSLGVAGMVSAAAAGYGISGVLAASGLSTFVATGLVILMSRRAYIGAVERHMVKAIAGEGAIFVPMVLAVWVVQNVDLYFVSWFAPDEVAPYRVASRIANGVSYFVAAYLTALGPLAGTPLNAAAQRQHGRAGVGARLLTYLVLACTWLVLALAVAADGLVQIAPSTYARSAELIAPLSLAVVAWGLFVTIYRTARIPAKRRRFAELATLAAVVFVLASLVMVPAFGSWGAALAPVVGFGVAVLALVILVQRGEEPIPFEVGRMAGGAAVGAGGLVLVTVIGDRLGAWRTPVEALLVVLYPFVLVLLGVVRRSEARTLLKLYDTLSPRGTVARRSELRRAVGAMAQGDRTALRRALRGFAIESPMSQGWAAVEIRRRALVALGEVAGTSREPSPHDDALGEYLFVLQPVVARDRLARQLAARGTDPADLHAMEITVGRVRRLPGRIWDPRGQTRTETKVTL